MSKARALLLLLVVLFAASPAGAQSFAVILDASGSPGRLDAVKSAINAAIRDLPQETQAGLYLYPVPTPEECPPVRELVQMAPLDKLNFMRAVSSLQPPDGRAPVMLDMSGATRRILSLRSRVTAVLVSTGLDTCGENPCDTVAALKALGVPFTLRVIGVQVSAAQAGMLACLAETSGGVYEGVSSPAEAAQALRRAFQVRNLTVRTLQGSAPLDARVEVFPAGSDQPAASARSGKAGVAEFSLPDGTYDVTVTDPQSASPVKVSFKGVSLAYGRPAERVAVIGGSELKVRVTKNGRPLDAPVDISRLDETGFTVQGRSGGDPPLSFHLEPGTYSVRVRDPENPARPAMTLPDVLVRAGLVLTLPVFFDEGLVEVRASRRGQPVNAQVEIISPGEKEPLASGPSGAETPRPFAVLPGSYTVRVTDPESRRNTVVRNVSVSPGKTAYVDAVIE